MFGTETASIEMSKDVQNDTLGGEPYALAESAARVIASQTGHKRHDLMIVLGSGWSNVAAGLEMQDEQPNKAINRSCEMRVEDLPGFPVPSAMGHGSTVRSFERNGLRVLAFLGRIHGYEGQEPAVVVHGVRTAAAAGCKMAILTNGAGYMRTDWALGSAVLISDHINFTNKSPLTGPNPPQPHGSRFCDLTDLYSLDLRALARRVDPTLADGVYLGLNGPHFETPAEIQAFIKWGADLVGMSTVLEAIAARHAKMRVLGISLATNLAAGLNPVALDGNDVIAAGNAAAPKLIQLLGGIIDRIADENVLGVSL
jgi:purine-nucleoside phosphorylase